MAKILLVDDDHDILRIGDKLLSMAGHEVLVASDAIQAMEHLNTSHFDAIISDARMPRFSGFQLIQTLKNDDRYDHMAVAMLTSLRERRDIEKAIRSGVDDYIVKPIDPALFLKKVEELFKKKPPKEIMEWQLPASNRFVRANAVVDVDLKVISELGVVALISSPLKPGTLFKINSEVFGKIGIEPPFLRVLSVSEVEDGLWEIKTGYFKLHFSDRQKSAT